MSATFRLDKKKAQQEELRRLMKLKTVKKESDEKIDSPLAKYNNIGQLTCVVCVSVVTAPWKVHVNTKRHRDSVQAALELKKKAEQIAAAPKRAASPPLQPAKKIKSILKNSKTRKAQQQQEEEVEAKKAEENLVIPQSSKQSLPATANDTNGVQDIDKNGLENEEAIPEGFFDDPVMDAKARNIQYKDPIEEEWEAFQKEIKEETSVSAAIIAGEQEEATAERQIDEIDEQIRIWSKVLDLERKKEETAKQKASQNNVEMDCDDNSSNDEEDFDEYLDWRAKKS